MIRREDVEAVYVTTPMQQAMLFHSLYSPGSGAYITQTSCTIDHLDVDAFRRAWDHVVADTPILRTAFVWKRIEEAKQVVVKAGKVGLPLQVDDWRDKSDREVPELRQQLVAAERERGFDLVTAPLMRLKLCRTSDESHWFLWSIHHILVDGWSQSCLLDDVFDAYIRLVMGSEPRSSGRPPFSRYVKWLEGQSLDEAKGAWREELMGFHGARGFGVDRPVLERYGPAGTYLEARRQLSPELCAAMSSSARRLGITLNTLFQGAWAILMARYTQEDDVVFGAVSSGRTAPVPDIDKMVGVLINTMPVRARVDDALSAREWLRELQSRQGALRRYDFLPAEEVRKAAPVPPGLPLYDSVLVFENFQKLAQIAAETRTSIRDVQGGQRINYPLALVVWPGEDIAFALAYDRRRFSDRAIARMQDDLVAVLAALLSDEARIGDIQIDRAGDELFAAGPRLPRPEGTLLDLLVERAAASPQRVAVAGDPALGDWDYRNLLVESERMARGLVKLGVRPGDRVAVDLRRSNHLVALCYGVFRAKAVFVAMSPEWPESRRVGAVRDADARCVITEQEGEPYGSVRALTPAACLELGTEAAALGDMPLPGDIAYVIYTSGSSGTPKGVALTHQSLMHNTRELMRILELDSEDRVGQLTSVAFDGFIADVGLALHAGGCMCLVPEGSTRSGTAFKETVDGLRISAMMLPPSYLAAVGERDLPTLRTIVAVGERLLASIVKRWQPGRRLLNGYGPTEMTICATLGPTDAAEDGDPPIGTPVANTSIYLLDRQLRPSIPEAPGELFISGPGEGVGYWKRPALTAERFVPNPFEGAGKRMYRTGDLARRTPVDALEFVGRVDHQVKVRGFRVELGEVEHRIREVPGVREAVVVIAGVSPDEATMAAFVQLDEGKPIEAVKEALARSLPPPMIPRVFHTVTEWPRTTVGKLDRLELARRATPRPATPPPVHRADSDSVRERLRAIWCRVLNISAVGDADDFFEKAGGDSLSAVRMVSQVEKEFGIEVPVKEVFKRPTIEALARVVGGERSSRSDESLWVSDSRLDDGIVPVRTSTEQPSRRVLLTGATGFVGRWVLRRLLESTDVVVECVVRAESDGVAIERLKASLQRTGYAADVPWDRCHILLGDLGRPQLGVPQREWGDLATSVDCVVNLGAWVNYLHPYSRLRAANVQATRDLLRLACEGTRKRFIHGSTLGMFRGGEPVLETTPPPAQASEETHRGYALTKVVSERLVWEAIARGLGGVICRMPDVVGDTVSGSSNQRDMLFMTFAACLKLGAAPATDYAFNAMPVDFVADAICALVTAGSVPGPCIHLASAEPLSLDAMLAAAASEGQQLRRLPLAEWLQLLAATGDEFAHLTALWSTLTLGGSGLTGAQWDTTIARRLLAEAGLRSPAIDEQLLRRYVRFARATSQ